MATKMVARDPNSVTLQITVPLGGSMLEMEEAIRAALNEAGAAATGIALERFDTDGSPIKLGDLKLTTRGRFSEVYQTPYGPTQVERHRYQTSRGGRTYVPLEERARIVLTATPMFAKMISHKYAELGSSRVARDLEVTLGRSASRSFIQDISEAVGAAILAKEETWEYATPDLGVAIKTVTVGLDGTCVLMMEEGWRETMVGTLALYDATGERQHTIYLAAAAEYGKETFLARLEREVSRVKRLYPRATMLGLADGAECNWTFLNPRTDDQIVDFYHAVQYLVEAATAVFGRRHKDREQWLDQACHDLKHKRGAATRLLGELEAWTADKSLGEVQRKAVQDAVTYFTNQKPRMKYAKHVACNHPIGSGVTEAACKTIVKMRLCGSSMKWKDRGASIILSLRTLAYSTGRWEQFWDNVDRYGFPLAA